MLAPNSYARRSKQASYQANKRAWYRTPKGVFYQHRVHARQRGIEWLFTFDTWYKLWQDSGHYAERGAIRGKWCMARLLDIGPYSPENCTIVPWVLNTTDARRKVKRITEKEIT